MSDPKAPDSEAPGKVRLTPHERKWIARVALRAACDDATTGRNTADALVQRCLAAIDTLNRGSAFG